MISLEKKGASTLTAVIEFKAIGSGALDIDVSVDDILDASGANLESLSASLTINIQEAPQPPPDPEATTAIVTPFELDGVPAVNVFGTDEDRYVWRSVQNLTLPSGFVDAEIIYGAETVGGATNGADEPTLLLYLSDINGENAGYYIFNAQYNTLQPYIVAQVSRAMVHTFMSRIIQLCHLMVILKQRWCMMKKLFLHGCWKAPRIPLIWFLHRTN